MKVYVILIAVEIALVEIEPEKNQACAGAEEILKIPRPLCQTSQCLLVHSPQKLCLCKPGQFPSTPCRPDII